MTPGNNLADLVCNYYFPALAHPCAIVLNGQRSSLSLVPPLKIAKETASHPLFHWQHYQTVIVTDGAWHDFSQTHIGKLLLEKGNVVVLGDGDSISEKPKHFIYLSRQDNTDFDKAIEHAVSMGFQKADVFWASGGEMDHFLGILSSAKRCEKQLRLRFFDSHHCYFLVHGDGRSTVNLKGVNGCTMSLYPFSDAQVSSRGLKYPLVQLQLNQQRQQSLRNVAISDKVELTVMGSLWIFVSHQVKTNC